MQVLLDSAGIGFILKAETVTRKGWTGVLNEKAEDEEDMTDKLPDFLEGERII